MRIGDKAKYLIFIVIGLMIIYGMLHLLGHKLRAFDFSAFSPNDARIGEIEKPKVNTIITQICETHDTVSFILKDYEITLPCAARRVFAASPSRNEDIDYTHHDYVEGVLPLPIRVLHFRLMDPEIYHSYWEDPPPAGVALNLYISANPDFSPNSKPSQRCEHYSSQSIRCDHLVVVPDTILMTQLKFNGGKTQVFSAKKITSESRPWAYYPEDEWPELYDRTERFVKSLIK